MVTEPYAPDRSEVIWIDFTPQRGHEHAGRRPAVVLTSVKYNRKVGLALVCPVTTQRKGYPFEVVIPDGLPVSGAVLADQIKSLDWRARRTEPLCVLPATTLDQVLEKARLLLA